MAPRGELTPPQEGNQRQPTSSHPRTSTHEIHQNNDQLLVHSVCQYNPFSIVRLFPFSGYLRQLLTIGGWALVRKAGLACAHDVISGGNSSRFLSVLVSMYTNPSSNLAFKLNSVVEARESCLSSLLHKSAGRLDLAKCN